MKQIKEIFNDLTTVQQALVVIILAIVLFFVTSGISYRIFSSKMVGSSTVAENTANIPGAPVVLDEDPKAPKTEVCPLNGQLRTKESKDIWVTRRPLAVMIENHIEARPQSGLSNADVVYEAVAEGGITRFMGVFYCNVFETQVGPVRSARTYFLDFLSEYDALYAHVGGANTPGPANALGQIEQYGIHDLNQFSIGFPTYWRDYQRLGHPVATEHTMYSTTKKLWDIGAKKGWTNVDDGVSWDKNFVSWKFKDEKPNSGATNKVEVNFWDSQPDYQVVWQYDSATNTYKRFNAGAPHLDLNKNAQLSPKVVIVQFMTESNANDGYENNLHMLYGTKGTGRALIFQDGTVTDGTWSKATRIAREKFFDKSGKELELNRGQIWIQTVSTTSKVVY